MYIDGVFVFGLVLTMMPVEVPQDRGAPRVVTDDESPRADTTLERLAKLETIYGSSTVTAQPDFSPPGSAMNVRSYARP